MSNNITNCGLIALEGVTPIETISMRTLINAAEDNGLSLFPYSIRLADYSSIKYPAIVHSENHFSYVEGYADLDLDAVTGYVLLSERSSYLEVADPKAITGASWVAVGAAAVSGGIKIAQGIKQKKEAKRLEAEKEERFGFISPALKENQALARQGAASNRSGGQGVDEANIRKSAAGARYSSQNLAGSAAQKLAASSSIENKSLDALGGLRNKGRNERLQRVMQLMNANRSIGKQQTENEGRFQDTRDALYGASQQNIYGGISSISDAVAVNAGGFGSGVGSTTSRKTGFGGFGNNAQSGIVDDGSEFTGY